MAERYIETTTDGQDFVVSCQGEWSIHNAAEIDLVLQSLVFPSKGRVIFKCDRLTYLDTAGAWLVSRLKNLVQNQGQQAVIQGASAKHAILLDAIPETQTMTALERPLRPWASGLIQDLGETLIQGLDRIKDFITFFGYVLAKMAEIPYSLKKMRGTSLAYHIEHIGIRSLPIIGLLNFLVGIVLAYQGADQLKRFNAEVLTVNLVGIVTLREVGVLLAAIIVAGRSGSAFTAQIGTMRVNEEIDAMRAIGLNPVQFLVVPRVLALLFCLPLLTFFSNMAGLLGGIVVCDVVLDIPPREFIEQIRNSVPLNALKVGLIKSPFFALIIATIGCYEGLKVTGSAESVGRQTTKSVVESIFMVIVLDAIFSIFFQRINM